MEPVVTSSLVSDIIRITVYKCKQHPDSSPLCMLNSCNAENHDVECKVTFYVHSAILCRNSDVFHRELNGHMKEANERTIALLDWDYNTVERLVEFLYTGDYKNPKPTSFLPQNVNGTSDQNRATNTGTPTAMATATIIPTITPAVATSVPSSSSIASASVSASNAKPVFGPLHLRGLLPTEQCTHSRSLCRRHQHPHHDVFVENQQIIYQKFPLATNSFTNVLLTHAAMYVIGEKYNLSDLCISAFDRLKRILTEHFVGDDMPAHILTEDFTNLIEYVYANTVSPVNSDVEQIKEEPLRNLLSTYAAWHIKLLSQVGGQAWQDFIVDGGDFVSDLFRKIGMRMNNGQYIDESEVTVGSTTGSIASNWTGSRKASSKVIIRLPTTPAQTSSNAQTGNTNSASTDSARPSPAVANPTVAASSTTANPASTTVTTVTATGTTSAGPPQFSALNAPASASGNQNPTRTSRTQTPATSLFGSPAPRTSSSHLNPAVAPAGSLFGTSGAKRSSTIASTPISPPAPFSFNTNRPSTNILFGSLSSPNSTTNSQTSSVFGATGSVLPSSSTTRTSTVTANGSSSLFSSPNINTNARSGTTSSSSSSSTNNIGGGLFGARALKPSTITAGTTGSAGTGSSTSAGSSTTPSTNVTTYSTGQSTTSTTSLFGSFGSRVTHAPGSSNATATVYRNPIPTFDVDDDDDYSA